MSQRNRQKPKAVKLTNKKQEGNFCGSNKYTDKNSKILNGNLQIEDGGTNENNVTLFNYNVYGNVINI